MKQNKNQKDSIHNCKEVWEDVYFKGQPEFIGIDFQIEETDKFKYNWYNRFKTWMFNKIFYPYFRFKIVKK